MKRILGFIVCSLFVLGSAGAQVIGPGNGVSTGIPFIYNTATQNLFVGPLAGNTSSLGTQNTCLGYQCLANITIPGSSANPQYNVAVGFQAGYNLTTARSSVLIGAGAGYSMTGNGAGIEDGLNTFVGSNAGYLDTTGMDNVALGEAAGDHVVTGSYNTFLGTHAGNLAVSSYNTYVGHQAGQGAVTTGNDNVAIGESAGTGLAGAATANVLIGDYTGGPALTSNYNVIIGMQSGAQLTSGSYDLFLGFQSGYSSTTGFDNTYIGYQSGFYNIVGHDNVGIGLFTLQNSTSTSNTAIGSVALRGLTTGYNNTSIGFGSGVGLTTGINNTLIGANIDSLSAGTSNIVVLATGDGTWREDFGFTNAGVWSRPYPVQSIGTAPTPSASGGACAVGAATGGTEVGIFATTGICATTNTITLTWAAGAATKTGHVCHFGDRTTPAALVNQTSDSTVTAVFTMGAVSTGATDTIQYDCRGY